MRNPFRPQLLLIILSVGAFIVTPAILAIRAQRAREADFSDRLSNLKVQLSWMREEHDSAVQLMRDAVTIATGLQEGQRQTHAIVGDVLNITNGNAQAIDQAVTTLRKRVEELVSKQPTQKVRLTPGIPGMDIFIPVEVSQPPAAAPPKTANAK